MLQELGTIEYFPCLQVTWEVSILELPVRLNIFDRILVRAFLLQQGKLYWNASAHYFSSFCSDLGQVMEKLSEIRKHWGIPNLSKMLIKWALEFKPCSIVTFLERVIISLNRKVPVPPLKETPLMLKELHMCRHSWRSNAILLVSCICSVTSGLYSHRFLITHLQNPISR